MTDPLAILDVIDGIVDETHPEGDGCPLCTALDDLREALTGPGAFVSRDLLIRAVDLRAIAWNTLCAWPAGGGSWERFLRKLHDLREAVNRPEHEDIRIAYASTFPDRPTKRDERRVLDAHWNIVPDPDSSDD